MTKSDLIKSLKDALPFLRPSALKLTGNAEDADDLLQDTYVKAFTQIEKFSEGSNLRAWMFTIMRNIFINNYQRMRRRKTFIDTTGILYYLNKGNKEGFEETLFKELVRDDLKMALRKIRIEQRTPFLMYFRGFQYNEIADILHLPLGTVKTRIFNARNDLKKLLSDYNYNFLAK